ncbi:hypothetical protein [Agrobacterium sp. 22117]|uniref:hypothetical protein n=1 Tax=Agrobacterium sp. 22117 TaxID=3453880 RepID=UPI003F844379
MTDLLLIDPIDFAGAIGHTSANQLFAILEGNPPEDENWFDGMLEKTESDVYCLADYVRTTEANGERLWRFACIEGLAEQSLPFPPSNFEDVKSSRRLAFNLFASTALLAFQQIQAAQMQELEPAEAPEQPGLKLADSIFEPHGSLADQEDFQAQWLEDQQAADKRALEEAEAKDAEADQAAVSAGTPIDDTDTSNKPPALSVGQQEKNADEKSTADQGQETRGQAEPDPSAQGDVSDMADDDGQADIRDAAAAAPARSSELEQAPSQPEGEASGKSDEGVSDGEAAAGATPADTGNGAENIAVGGDHSGTGGAEQSTDEKSAEGTGGAAGEGVGVQSEAAKTPVKPKSSRKSKSTN